MPTTLKIPKGLNRDIVISISEQKNEPGWMTDFRLKALEQFERMPMPTWGADLSGLDPDDIYYDNSSGQYYWIIEQTPRQYYANWTYKGNRAIFPSTMEDMGFDGNSWYLGSNAEYVWRYDVYPSNVWLEVGTAVLPLE